MLPEAVPFFLLSKILIAARKALLLGLAVSIFYIAFITLPIFDVSRTKRESVPIKMKELSAPEMKISAEIDKTLFASDSTLKLTWVPNLQKSLRFMGKNTRPQLLEQEAPLLLVIPDSKEKITVPEGKKIFLTYKKENGQSILTFSKEKTPLMIKPFFLSDHHVKIEVLLRFFDEDEKLLISENDTFVLEEMTESEKVLFFREELAHFPAYKELSKAICLGPDKFYDLSVASELAEKREKHRMKFSDEGNSLFVKEGDYIVFDGSEWKFQSDFSSLPLAKIAGATQNRVDIDFWDEKGFIKTRLTLPLQKIAPPSVRPEETFTRIKRRTASTVSLKLGGKSVFLKKGDWLVHQAKGWQFIKSAEERKKCLENIASGELFIFQGVVKEKGKNFFKGHIFDPTRSSCTEIKIPLMNVKAPERKKTEVMDHLKQALETDQ